MSNHNIAPENIIFCYRDGDTESLDVATYYATLRSLPSTHLVALPCVSDQTINESQFETQIRQPLIAALNILDIPTDSSSGSVPHAGHRIWIIILGYNVPNFYVDSNGETIPCASRIQRIREEYTGQILNPTYNKQIFEFFTELDIEDFYITAILDGPSATVVKQIILRATILQNTDVITGKVYLDPYGLCATEEQTDYRDILTDFEQSYLPNLGLDSAITVESAFDPTFRSFEGDSFYWGWYTPYCPKSIFANQSEQRVFLYNADNTAASNIRATSVSDSVKWCNASQAINPVYAATAGATEDPGIDAYLKPEPFFRALQMGATLGEAFMSSCKYLDWKIVLIGDPFLSINFPAAPPLEPYGPASSPSTGNVPGVVSGDLLQSNQVGQTTKERLENTLFYRQRAYSIITVVTEHVLHGEMIEEISLLNTLNNWKEDLETKLGDIFSRAITKWYLYATETSRSDDTDEWFEDNSEKTTSLFANQIETQTSTTVDDEYIYPSSGFWNLTFYYIHGIQAYEEAIHFEIDVLDYKTHAVVLSVSSLVSTDGWQYESRPDYFVDIGDGFPSSLSGRRIRFRSSVAAYLSPLEIYNVRFRAIYNGGTSYSAYTTLDDPMIVHGSVWEGFLNTSPNDSVVFYADCFGLAIQSEEFARDTVWEISNYVKNACTASMPVYTMTNGQDNKGYIPLQRKQEFTAALNDLANTLDACVNTTTYSKPAFDGLYNYVQQTYGQGIDDYLTDRGLKVNATFAAVSDAYGVPISPGNIE